MNKVRVASILAACLFFFNWSVSAQAIQLKLDKVNVKQAISELKRNTGYSFVYEAGDIDTKKVVSVDATDLKQAVNQIIAGQDITYTIKGQNIVISKKQAEKSNDNQVTGQVHDVSGAPIIGVTVAVKGTTKGAATDTSGNFHLNDVKPGSTLEFSFVGYKSQEIVWNGQTLNVVLEEDLFGIEQVVVVGYGTMKKADLTGSITRADLTSVKTAPNYNIMQALQGSVPGLNITNPLTAGAKPTLQVRGQTTIAGNTEPLLVLDGIIYNGSISDISPTDVESIDVLKDASSKAIYGSKAANGVIIITTKGGRKEAAPKITYTTNWSWSTPTVNIRPLNAKEWSKYIRDVDYRNAYTAESGYLEENPDWTHPEMNGTVAEAYEAGQTYDWWGNATRTGHLHTNTVSISGGTKNVSYFVSGGYTDQGNIVKGDDYSRTSLRTNIDVRIRPWLTVGTNTFLAFLDYSGDSPSIDAIARMPVYVQPKNADGSWNIYPTGQNSVNPFLTGDTKDSERGTQINSTIYAVVNIPWVKGLSYRLNYNFTRNPLVHQNFDGWTSGQQGVAYGDYSSTDFWMLDNIINYTNSFGKHNVNATLVYGANEHKGGNFKAEGTGYANDKLSYNVLQTGTIQKIYSGAWEETSLYQMARVAYNYDSRYYFTATIRRDGFSGFAANHKFGYLPSVGLGWTISNEKFMDKAKWVDNLKLRASYGVSGNRTGRYNSLAIVGATGGYVFGDGAQTSAGINTTTLANNDLTWETTGELNLGVDFSFFKHRLNGNIDVFNARTTNLLWAVAVPQMTGFGAVYGNVGELNLKGIEVELEGVPVQTKDFRWTIKANFSATKDKIVSLTGEDADGDGKEDDLVDSGLFIGKSLSTIYNYEVEGIWQLEDEANGLIPEGYYPGTYRIKDQDGDGLITPDKDRVILGRQTPAWRMGIRNTFEYKGFNLSFFINVVNGGKDGYLSFNSLPSHVSTLGNASVLNVLTSYDYWSPSNPNAKYADRWLTPTVSANRLQQRNFVRLQDVSLGYTFSKELLGKVKIDNLRLYVSAKNLLTFTKWDGWDPENNLGMGGATYPVMKTFAFGAEITF